MLNEGFLTTSKQGAHRKKKKKHFFTPDTVLLLFSQLIYFCIYKSESLLERGYALKSRQAQSLTAMPLALKSVHIDLPVGRVIPT